MSQQQMSDHIDAMAKNLRALFESQQREAMSELKQEIAALFERVRQLEFRTMPIGPGISGSARPQNQPAPGCTCGIHAWDSPDRCHPPCPIHGLFRSSEVTCATKIMPDPVPDCTCFVPWFGKAPSPPCPTHKSTRPPRHFL